MQENRVRPEAKALSGISAAGRALKASVAEIMGAYIERLAADPALPEASRLSAPDLEDHAASLLIDIAQALIATAESDADVPALLQDGTQIQRLISALHGAQRARLAWREGALEREFRILREEVDAAVRRNAPAEAQIDRGLDLVHRALEQARLISLEHWRAAG